MIRIFLFLVGFGLMVLGFSFIILYLNYLTIGYNFKEYVNFISSRLECYNIIIGFIIIVLSIFFKGDKKNDIRIWYYFKFS
jgi:hypothetical protein